MSSKSSRSGRPTSMFSSRLSSFLSEKTKGESPQTSDVEFGTPSVGSTNSSPFFETVADEVADEKVKKTERRKSMLGLLSNYIHPLLTPQSTDRPASSHQTLHRKPVLAHPSAAYDAETGTEAGLSNLNLDSAQAAPAHEQHARKGSLPNMLRKVRRSSPDSGASAGASAGPGPHPLSIPPVQSPPALSAPSASEPQLIAPTSSTTRPRGRSNSSKKGSTHQQHGQPHARNESSSSNSRFRSSSAQPPTARSAHPDSARIASTPAELLSHSRDSSIASTHQPEGKKLKRSWLRKSSSQDMSKQPSAWIMVPGNTVDYNTSFLANGERVPELWDESGDVYLYLGSRGSHGGPSFKVSSYVLSSSRVFNEMLEADAAFPGFRGRDRERNFSGQSTLTAEDAHRSFMQAAAAEVSGEAHIYLDVLEPNVKPDLEHLIAVRNLFAFLAGQPLVGTRNNPKVFNAFLQIAALLKDFGFSSYDGTSFGEAVDVAFASCIEQLGLADVRHSREKTIETLILGERMRSAELYTEGFVHAVGKYDSIRDLKSPLYELLSNSTRLRVERANLDLFKRRQNINTRLDAFEVPSLFAGIASSTATLEYKDVRFKEWQKNFLKMRTFALGYYKHLFGNWPPKARSKKNQFSESGLNRQCLKILYSDMCALYDLLVDRESVTPRVIDQSPLEIREASTDPRISALRQMLTEYDQSSPPVLPPVPYDVPKLPSMTAIREDYNELPAKQQTKFDKSIQPHELLLILIKSRNIDTDQLQIPFLEAFKEFEHKEAKGCNPQDMADQRIGYWLFLYVVIQALPMLVVDAPGLRHTEGVEYFLCEPPQGNLPWMEDLGEVRKVWYEVSGGQNIVELSADVVMFSVEATYHRSHCWLSAALWEAESAAAAAANPQTLHTTAAQAAHYQSPPPSHHLQQQQLSSLPMLEPPHAVFQDLDPYSSPVSTPGSGIGTPPYAGSPTLLPLRSGGSGSGPPSPTRNSSPAAAAAAAARSSGHPYRSSIVIGLEPLAMPPPSSSELMPGEADYGGGRSRSRSRAGSTSDPWSRGLVSRNGSAVNLHQLASRDTGLGEGGGSGSTFDDILKGIEKDKEKGKKKKSSFF